MSMPEVTDEVRDVDDVYVGIVEVDMVDEEIEENSTLSVVLEVHWRNAT